MEEKMVLDDFSKYCIEAGLFEWCDGFFMKFRFGEVYVLLTNEYEYFTEMWIWRSQTEKPQVFKYLTRSGTLDILSQLATQVIEAPSLVDPLVVEGEVLVMEGEVL
jgi:hypothetical protein